MIWNLYICNVFEQCWRYVIKCYANTLWRLDLIYRLRYYWVTVRYRWRLRLSPIYLSLFPFFPYQRFRFLIPNNAPGNAGKKEGSCWLDTMIATWRIQLFASWIDSADFLFFFESYFDSLSLEKKHLLTAHSLPWDSSLEFDPIAATAIVFTKRRN